MRRYDAYGSPPIGGWCTPQGTIKSPAAIFRDCHLQKPARGDRTLLLSPGLFYKSLSSD
jgi:hypothetical protein